MHRRRMALAASLSAAALAGLVAMGAWMRGALAGEPPAVGVDAPPSQIDLAVTAGRHLRIDGPRGPVHVWIPASYRADTGATVIYLHGYYDNVDTAWTGHQLPQQFAASALNAIFIAPEAPISNRQGVNYPDLGELLRLVEDSAQVPRGAVLTAVVGHSGAFRTIESWLDEPLVDQLVLVDSMYGDEDALVRWFKASPRRRMIVIGEDTIVGTESLVSKLPEPITLDRVPAGYDLFPREARGARLVYIRAQFNHMQLVTEGIVLPSALRLLPIEKLADSPWQVPLGGFAPVPDAALLPDDAALAVPGNAKR